MPVPVWCLAKMQTAGQGRRGRAWAFQSGNFAASLRMAPAGGLPVFARYSFVAALALHDALAAATGAGDRLGLKWPNDVLLDCKKTCGILLESSEGAHGTDLVVGIGVNLAVAPSAAEVEPGAVEPGSVEALTGRRVPPAAFLDMLAPRFAAWSTRMECDGFAWIRDAWRARAVGLGSRIVARLPNATHEGIFEDIDADGALMLRTGRKLLVLPAADVYFAATQ